MVGAQTLKDIRAGFQAQAVPSPDPEIATWKASALPRLPEVSKDVEHERKPLGVTSPSNLAMKAAERPPPLCCGPVLIQCTLVPGACEMTPSWDEVSKRSSEQFVDACRELTLTPVSPTATPRVWDSTWEYAHMFGPSMFDSYMGMPGLAYPHTGSQVD